jgi:hypothetical protein
MDFCGNLIEYVNDDCIETDGAGSNCRIYNNIFKKFLAGVSTAPAAIGPTYIFRNIFSGWETHSGYIGYPVKFNVESDLTTSWVYLYHNTCHTSVAGQPGFLFKEYCDWRNVVSRNNIFAGTEYALESWPEENPVDFDYDGLYTSASGTFIEWADAKYAALEAFTGKSGQEAHGVAADPKFVDAPAGNFHLSEASPLIDKGVAIPNVNDGFAGRAPDIGCFESGTTGSLPLVNKEKPIGKFAAHGSTTTGGITLEISGVRQSAPIRVTLFNLGGRRIYSGEVRACNGSARLSMKTVTPGVYCAQASLAGDEYPCRVTVVK